MQMKAIILDLFCEEKLKGQSRPSLACLAWLGCCLVFSRAHLFATPWTDGL